VRIKHVEIVGHPGIGDVSLSFTDQAGSTYPVIVLAGGNGTGKTAILDAIQKSFEGGLGGGIGKISLELECEATDLPKLSAPTHGQITAASPPTRFALSYDSNVDNWNAFQVTGATATGEFSTHAVMPSPPWRAVFKSFLSEAALDFQTGSLKSVTTLTLDDPEATPQRSGQNLAQRIGQLIIDIRAADAEDLSAWVSANPGIAPPLSIRNVRFARFEKAFNAMFPYKRFEKIERSNGRINVNFSEFGRISTLNTLSSGEKQIVFRAGFLLQNLRAVCEGIVLVDEPELSLHPEWQARIIDFYIALLSDENGFHPQIIVSTHSPFIVHGAVGAKAIILQKDSATGKVSEMPAPHYDFIEGSAATRAFNIEPFLKTSAMPMLILTEGETDAEILNSAWDKLRPGKPRFFETRAALGDRNIAITLNDQQIFNRLGTKMIVGLFDFDEAFNRWNGVWGKGASNLVSSTEEAGLVKRHKVGRGWAMLLPVPYHRKSYASLGLKGSSALSIEFLFEDKDIPFSMIANKPMPLGVHIPYFRDEKKTAFAEHVKTLPVSSFGSFETLITRLEDIFSGRI
jgi:predicted ATPase